MARQRLDHAHVHSLVRKFSDELSPPAVAARPFHVGQFVEAREQVDDRLRAEPAALGAEEQRSGGLAGVARVGRRVSRQRLRQPLAHQHCVGFVAFGLRGGKEDRVAHRAVVVKHVANPQPGDFAGTQPPRRS